MNKISHYFSTLELIRGLSIALLASAYIYMEYWEIAHPFLVTLFGLLSLYLLLDSDQKVWFWTGAFIGIFWFWWIVVSFKHYDMLWAIPIAMFFISLLYGILFWFIAKIASIPVGCCVPTTPKKYFSKWCCQGTTPYTSQLLIKALGLLTLSYIHPFGFDWLKPELMFVNSYLGIEKWQFALVLGSIALAIWKRQLLYLFFVLLAYPLPSTTSTPVMEHSMALVTMHTGAEDKWNTTLHEAQFEKIFERIDQAIEAKKSLIVLPESVFPIFLNYEKGLLTKLKKKAKQISIVTGALYWDGKTPYNSSYIFTDGKTTIANKVLLVPFGESNPLPDFLSDWVNEVFYDGAVDYKASKNVVDYTVDGVTYRNAICFEATSEKLYEGRPENMIVLSNNSWFTPSIEPTLQRLLLQYYSKKYGTTIYHAVNMSASYSVKKGKVRKVETP